jgi:hypothetical protein
MKTDDTFRLSRIQAEGWNAARRVATDKLGQMSNSKIDALNPHVDEAERTRWSAGFKSAIESWTR